MKAGSDPLGGGVTAWLARVSTAQPSLGLLQALLDERELQRAARFRFTEDRARFILGRGLLRRCLGRYLDRDPAAIELAYTPRGRPFLPDNEEVQFSISHTRDLVAIAVTFGAQVGIDIEYVQAKLTFIELAAQIFSDADFRIFRALRTAEKPVAFFRAWTRKEAYLKARGEGITEDLQRVSVSFAMEEPARLNDAREAGDSWRLYSPPLPEGYMGSLACDDPARLPQFNLVRLEGDQAVLAPITGAQAWT